MKELSATDIRKITIGLFLLSLLIVPVTEYCRQCPTNCPGGMCEVEIACKRAHGFNGFLPIFSFLKSATVSGQPHLCQVSPEIDPTFLLTEWILLIGLNFLPRAREYQKLLKLEEEAKAAKKKQRERTGKG